MAQERQFRLSDIERQLEDGSNQADVERAAALERLQLARRARGATLQREQARLSAKYGDDHPRVRELAARAAINEGFLNDLKVETVRASTNVPDVDANTWGLHGYVRNPAGAGIPNLTVALFDPDGGWLKQLGYGCTDENGYFRMTTTNNLIREGWPVHIHVLNSAHEHLYIAPKPLTPAPGNLDYREIVLTGEAQICPPPGTTQDEAPRPDMWTVRGRVTNQHGEGLSGLIVNLFDEDLIFNDRLGQTETDEQGYYIFNYNTEDFRDFFESKPDIYLEVLDKKRRTLYSSERVRYEAGRVETINVTIER